jgi:hypothetical protein
MLDSDRPRKSREKKKFVTCDVSDLCSGAVLSWGETWESARPVAFDSTPLHGTELNYPVHEKELLAILRALKKWRSDLLGSHIHVYMDHRTLLNFNNQKDLSRRQARWQEYMSQFEISFVYIRGEDNTVADALSRLEHKVEMTDYTPNYRAWHVGPGINAVLCLSADSKLLEDIHRGYTEDTFCKRLKDCERSFQSIKEINNLWYIGECLVVPRTGTIHEDLFRLAHDTLGHFGAQKSYEALRNSYYWPNMRRDLEESYIPSCSSCQRNKAPTTKPRGLLHPLPVPDECGERVAMDFIGPLLRDNGYDCIMTMTDALGSDIWIIPTKMTLSAEECAENFFTHWYCENGLLKAIGCDRDKLFISQFWRALCKLMGVKLKMSSAYHPETDGSSERTNKTVNQCICFHVNRSQKG